MAKIRLIISTEEADKVQASLADHCARRFHYGGGKAFCERTVNGTGPLTLTYYEYYWFVIGLGHMTAVNCYLIQSIITSLFNSIYNNFTD